MKRLLIIIATTVLLSCGKKKEVTPQAPSTWPKNYTHWQDQTFNGETCEIYYTHGKVDFAAAKELCHERMIAWKGESFFYIAIFDKKENCRKSNDQLSIGYSNEEDKAKHIFAHYIYNPANGYSKMFWFVKNMWESPAREYPI